MERVAGAAGDFEARRGRSKALLIGVGRYEDDRLGTLPNARRDVEAVGRQLRELTTFDWEVTVLPESATTRDGILDALEAFENSLGPNDRAFFYFAGHGAPHRLAEAVGYMQPSDADPSRDRTWISFEELRGILSDRGPRHALVMLDCCYGGRLTAATQGLRRRGDGASGSALDLLAHHAHVILTSGLSGEQVFDSFGSSSQDRKHSPFARAFLTALSSDRPVLTSRSLYAQIADSYIESGLSAQTPTWALFPEQTKGDFAFFLSLERGASLSDSPRVADGLPSARFRPMELAVNEEDLDALADQMCKGLLLSRELDYYEFEESPDKRIILFYGGIANETSEHVDTVAIWRRMESTLFASGKFRFTAASSERRGSRRDLEGEPGLTQLELAIQDGKSAGAHMVLVGALSCGATEARQAGSGARLQLRVVDVHTGMVTWTKTAGSGD